MFLAEEKFILELLLGEVFQVLGILLLKGRCAEGIALDSFERQVHQLEFCCTCELAVGVLVLNYDDLFLGVQPNPLGDTLISHLDELYLRFDEPRVLIEEFAEKFLLQSHLTR